MIYTHRQLVEDAYNVDLSIDDILKKLRNRPPYHHKDLDAAFEKLMKELEGLAPSAPKVTLEFIQNELSAEEAAAFIYRFGAQMKLEQIAERIGKKFSDVVPLIMKPLDRLKKVWKKKLSAEWRKKNY